LSVRDSEIPTFILRTDKMEKLIELLNEYCKEKKIWEWSILENGYFFHWNKPIKNKKEEFDLLVISKEYEFIKRLVDNDKIFLWDIVLKVYNLDLRAGKHTYTEYPIYESLLMLLSIQDEPIEFLVSVLK